VADYLPPKQTFRLTQIEPIKELRTLELEFSLPAFLDHYASKPLSLIGSLIGHEGKGSLLSLLKEEDLATALGAGRGGPMSGLSPDYGKFSASP
jgi:insulysin